MTTHKHDPRTAAAAKGWAVLKQCEVHGDGVQAPGFVTLCNNGSVHHPYVVHFFNSQDGGFHSGFYRADLIGAEAEYSRQCERMTRHHARA
jgi:hypothetical protein